MRHLLATAAGLLALAVPSPAHGDTWSAPDPAGNVDGTQYDPEPAPCGSSSDIDASHRRDLDITRLSVRHGRRDVVVTVRFADLVDGRRSSVEVPLLTPRGDWTVDVQVSPRGRSRTTWLPGYQSAVTDAAAESDDPDDCGDVFIAIDVERCRGLHAERSVAADTMEVVVPRSCLGDPRAVRAGASTSQYQDTGDDTFRVLDDRWAPAGRDHGFFVYGPWVRRTT